MISIIKRSIKNRVTFYLLATTIVSLLISSITSYMIFKKTLISNKIDNLLAIRDSKIIEVISTGGEFTQLITNLSYSKLVQDMVTSLETISYSLGLDLESDNDLENNSTYQNETKKFEDIYQELFEQYRLKNIYIVMNNGSLLSQAKKDIYLGKNLLKGKLKDSTLANVYRSAKDGIYFSDISYSNEISQVTGYLAIPLISKYQSDIYKKNDKMGVIIAELHWYTINRISEFKTGLGESGQIYIVGKDQLLRTDILHSKETHSFQNSQKDKISINILNILEKENGTDFRLNHLNTRVLTSVRQFNFLDKDWIMVVEISEKEIFSSINTLKNFMLSLFVILTIIITILGFYLGNSLGGPIKKMAQASFQIANGNMSIVTDVSNSKNDNNNSSNAHQQKDEIGECFSSINTVVTVLLEVQKDLEIFTNYAINGQLDHRLDDHKYHGSYQKIINGVNSVLNEITRPIEELVFVLKNISEGNLTSEMNGNYNGDYVILKDSINNTLASLNSVMKQFKSVLSELSSLVEAFATINKTLITGIGQQSTSIEEISSMTTEITAQVQKTSENAIASEKLNIQLVDKIKSCNEKMKILASAIEDISNSSKNISSIIKIIDDITVQTNLLAINASVEAARAGKHGKGFAVVAEEVRNLASKSALNAKETSSLVEGSLSKIAMGMDLARSTAEDLNSVVNGMETNTNLTALIGQASIEQRHGIEEINKGVKMIEKVVKENYKNVEDSQTLMEKLVSQSQSLSETIEKFKLSA
ncbi:MAG: methyl-accepting chemotaxis protein [Oligoflexia bacterium]|nr:methyl-accepting chemotaxis protein [Oligoflexia bacterium]